MRERYSAHGPCWASQLLLTAATRAGARLTEEPVATALDKVGLVLPSVTTDVAAARVPPSWLRLLDPLHLANALEIGADLEGMVVSDLRLKGAADRAAILTVTPGAALSGWRALPLCPRVTLPLGPNLGAESGSFLGLAARAADHRGLLARWRHLSHGGPAAAALATSEPALGRQIKARVALLVHGRPQGPRRCRGKGGFGVSRHQHLSSAALNARRSGSPPGASPVGGGAGHPALQSPGAS